MISVVIPVYKNTQQFLQNIKQNIPYVKQCEIIIVNDDPSLSISEEIKKYPFIKLIENKKNLGFAGSAHVGIINTSSDFVLLLNSDVLLFDDSYKKASSLFEKQNNLFAVSFAQEEKDHSIVGRNILFWRNGMMEHKKAEKMDSGITAWAEGGAVLLDKKKYMKIEGFDSLFNPFYWEDIDLSYRAWKMGFSILFSYDIKVKHHHESTIKKYYPLHIINRIAYRNQFLFVWKNVSDFSLICSHFFHLPYILISAMLKQNFTLLQGFFCAVYMLPRILKRRYNSNIKDRIILNKFL